MLFAIIEKVISYLSLRRSFVLRAQERRRSSLRPFHRDTHPSCRRIERNPTNNSRPR